MHMTKYRYYLIVVLTIGAVGLANCKEDKNSSKAKGYYTCSMHPQVIQQEPGKCPICGMKLTYVEAMSDPEHKDHADLHKDKGDKTENAKEENQNFRFSLSQTLLTNSNLATVPATKEVFSRQAKYSAHVDYNEDADKLVIVSTKYDGWIERLLVSKEGQFVKRGQALIGFYSPNILAAKEEYVTTYNTIKSLYQAQNKPIEEIYKDPTLKAARRKLSYLDVSASQISKLEKEGKAGRRNYYTSPISGVVVKKQVLQGAFVKSGQEILRIANLSKLWVFIHIFEKDLSFIKKGQKVKLKTTAYPDKQFNGRIDLIYPFLDPQTKDIKVRIVVGNQRNLLKPGMFAEVSVASKLPGQSITIPDSTVIYSGEKSYVFVSLGSGKFELRPVQVKVSSNGKAVISKGLSESDLVVANGQFLLDSEASLKEAVSKGAMVGHDH